MFKVIVPENNVVGGLQNSRSPSFGNRLCMLQCSWQRHKTYAFSIIRVQDWK